MFEPGPRRLIRSRSWDAIAVMAVVVLLTSLSVRGHFHTEVRLSETRWLAAPSFMSVLAVVALVAALTGKRHEVAGLIGLAASSVGLGAFWLLLRENRWAGPVVLELSETHGIHAADFLAGVPILGGMGLALVALRSLRSGRAQARPDKKPTTASQNRSLRSPATMCPASETSTN